MHFIMHLTVSYTHLTNGPGLVLKQREEVLLSVDLGREYDTMGCWPMCVNNILTSSRKTNNIHNAVSDCPKCLCQLCQYSLICMRLAYFNLLSTYLLHLVSTILSIILVYHYLCWLLCMVNKRATRYLNFRLNITK